MRVQTVTCDRCKTDLSVEAQKTYGQVWDVEVRFTRTKTSLMKAEWCRTCCVEMGILGDEAERAKVNPVEPKPTIEDFIREIVREETEARG